VYGDRRKFLLKIPSGGACAPPLLHTLQLLFALFVLLALLILLVALDAVVLLHVPFTSRVSLLLWRKARILCEHFPGKGVETGKSLCYNVSLENCVIF